MGTIKKLALTLLTILVLSSPSYALDTLAGTNLTQVNPNSVNEYLITWPATCSAGGAATATLSQTLLTKLRGYHLFRVCSIATTGGTAPDASYTLKVYTAGTYDVTQGGVPVGSATLETCGDMLWTVSENITFTIAAGGNAANITVKALFIK
jgi:hypothetical protein